MGDIHNFKRWLSMLNRAAEAAPVVGDVLTYQGNNQVQWLAGGLHAEAHTHQLGDPNQIDHGAALTGLADDDHIRYLDGRDDRCHVYHNANQNINNAAWTALTFNSERFDPNAMHNPAVNPSRITIATTGTYLVGGCIEFAASATDQTRRFVSLSINGVPGVGTEITRHQHHMSEPGGAGLSHGLSLSCLWEFTAADFVELCVWQNSGGGTQEGCLL
jgi:hypothetical protein